MTAIRSPLYCPWWCKLLLSICIGAISNNSEAKWKHSCRHLFRNFINLLIVSVVARNEQSQRFFFDLKDCEFSFSQIDWNLRALQIHSSNTCIVPTHTFSQHQKQSAQKFGLWCRFNCVVHSLCMFWFVVAISECLAGLQNIQCIIVKALILEQFQVLPLPIAGNGKINLYGTFKLIL